VCTAYSLALSMTRRCGQPRGG